MMLRLAIILTAMAIGITFGIVIANRYWKRRAGQRHHADEELVAVPRTQPLWRGYCRGWWGLLCCFWGCFC